MAGFWKASLETRRFSFEAFGRTEGSAREALAAGLARHGEQYGLEPDWAAEMADDILTCRVALGDCRRDSALLTGAAK